uniref:Uncharacterized protein n=1 Tax=viral metagenome TaxID=1070528 RepID=A0A6M3JJ34_9ZZZZ
MDKILKLLKEEFEPAYSLNNIVYNECPPNAVTCIKLGVEQDCKDCWNDFLTMLAQKIRDQIAEEGGVERQNLGSNRA